MEISGCRITLCCFVELFCLIEQICSGPFSGSIGSAYRSLGLERREHALSIGRIVPDVAGPVYAADHAVVAMNRWKFYGGLGPDPNGAAIRWLG
jgi:hypothetical protein